MKFVKLDVDGLVRMLLGSPTAKPSGDFALVKIVLQMTRTGK